MEENQNNLTKENQKEEINPKDENLKISSSGPWWKEGMQIFSDVSTWIVVPIILALIFGKWLDKKYGTEPWLFISLAVLGFLVTTYGIIKSVKKYIEKNKK